PATYALSLHDALPISCWCAFALPPGMAEAMLAAWRSEVNIVWPEVDEDAVLFPHLLEAQILWVWVSTWWFLPKPGESDGPIDGRDRKSTRLNSSHVSI